MPKTEGLAFTNRQLAEQLARIKMGKERDRPPNWVATAIRASAQLAAKKNEDITRGKPSSTKSKVFPAIWTR
jgi:hypothetical protein